MIKIAKLKCALIAALFAVMIFIPKANAQEERSNVIKVDLSGLPMGFYGFSYERVFGESTSAQLYFDIISGNFELGDVNAKWTGFTFMPEVRYYLSSKGAPRGFFFGAYVPYRTITIEGSMKGEIDNGMGTQIAAMGSVKSKFSFVGFGINMGSQWLIADRVSLEFHWGAAFGSGSLKDTEVALTAPGTTNTEVEKFDFPVPLAVHPRFGLTLGVAF